MTDAVQRPANEYEWLDLIRLRVEEELTSRLAHDWIDPRFSLHVAAVKEEEEARPFRLTLTPAEPLTLLQLLDLSEHGQAAYTAAYQAVEGVAARFIGGLEGKGTAKVEGGELSAITLEDFIATVQTGLRHAEKMPEPRQK